MKPDSLMRGPVFRVRGAVVRHSSAVCVVVLRWSLSGQSAGAAGAVSVVLPLLVCGVYI